MDKVVFLDRDGTINKEVSYLYHQEEFRLLPGVVDGLRLLQDMGFRLVVVTNQAGVARGYYTEEDVDKLHEYMKFLLKEHGITIDHIFYCPHHPVHGIGDYKKQCECRKPAIGMLEKAEDYYQIDKSRSYMIGDKLLDAEAGKRFGITSILVGTGYGVEEHNRVVPEKRTLYYEHYSDTLLEAAQWIRQQEDTEA